MSGLWCEHFKEYASTTQLLDGVFAEIGGWAITTAAPLPRAGASWLAGPGDGSKWRRIFGAPKTAAGVGFRFYADQLPSIDGNNGESILAGFTTAGNLWQGGIALGADGGVIVFTGGSDLSAFTVVGRSPPAITARTWQYVEVKIAPATSGGSIEVRVNGTTVHTFTGDTDPQTAGEVSQVFVKDGQDYHGGYVDLHAWDTNSGNGPSDFVGNSGVFRRELNGDTATADWSLSGGSTGYTLLIDQDDTTFIEADTTTLKSAFQAGDLPVGTSAILYQQVKMRGLKTDSADCDVAASMISGADETTVTGQAMTSLDTWRWSIFGDDPATSAPWTLAAANASDPAVTRTL